MYSEQIPFAWPQITQVKPRKRIEIDRQHSSLCCGCWFAARVVSIAALRERQAARSELSMLARLAAAALKSARTCKRPCGADRAPTGGERSPERRRSRSLCSRHRDTKRVVDANPKG
jgi:hypothetical protein